MDGREQLVSVKQLGVAAHWSREALTIERLSLLPGDIEGSLSVTGRVMPQGQTLRGLLDASGKTSSFRKSWPAVCWRAEGELHFEGTPERVSASRQASTSGRPAIRALCSRCNGTAGAPTIEKLDPAATRRPAGLAAASWTSSPIRLEPARQADDFNPGALLAHGRGAWTWISDARPARGGRAARQPGHEDAVRKPCAAGRSPARGRLDFAAPSLLAGICAELGQESRRGDGAARTRPDRRHGGAGGRIAQRLGAGYQGSLTGDSRCAACGRS